jgi:hypothetical protein
MRLKDCKLGKLVLITNFDDNKAAKEFYPLNLGIIISNDSRSKVDRLKEPMKVGEYRGRKFVRVMPISGEFKEATWGDGFYPEDLKEIK